MAKYTSIIWGTREIGWTFAEHKAYGGEPGRLAGVDIATPRDSQIKAGWDGTVYVAKSYTPTDLRNYVTLKHDGFFSEYGHLKDIKVKKGQAIKAGQLLGYSGAGTPPRWLHFAVIIGNLYIHTNRVDPIAFMFPPKPQPKPDPCEKVKAELKECKKEVKVEAGLRGGLLEEARKLRKDLELRAGEIRLLDTRLEQLTSKSKEEREQAQKTMSDMTDTLIVKQKRIDELELLAKNLTTEASVGRLIVQLVSQVISNLKRPLEAILEPHSGERKDKNA